MEDGMPVAESASRDQAIHARTDCEASTAGRAVEKDGILKHLNGQRCLHDRESEHRFAGDAKCALLPEALQNFLDYR
jgi:hypothetical protein